MLNNNDRVWGTKRKRRYTLDNWLPELFSFEDMEWLHANKIDGFLVAVYDV